MDVIFVSTTPVITITCMKSTIAPSITRTYRHCNLTNFLLKLPSELKEIIYYPKRIHSSNVHKIEQAIRSKSLLLTMVFVYTFIFSSTEQKCRRITK